MKKVITLLILFLLLPLSMSAQAPGGHITRKKPNTTTPAPAKRKPQSSTAGKNTKSGKRSAAPVGSGNSHPIRSGANKPYPNSTEISQAQKGIIQNLMANMVHVEGGTFMMGATAEQGGAFDFEKPAHQVTLSSFSIGRYEVTQEEWQAVMGSNPSGFKGSRKPVESVSWNDCQEFIRKLNTMTGKNFRLPTEAEWEFASRGGIKSQGYIYSGSNNLNSVAWYDDNTGTHDVGQKSPNELGLYDMSGNVNEWCSDWYGNYSSSSQTNPTGAYSGSDRVSRGGGWYGNVWFCRVSARLGRAPDIRYDYLGFRLAH